MPLRGRNLRGFPFDEEETSGAWSELAARHPDIAARLRQRPATWARKRRPSSQDATDDFGDGFSGFDRFPFDDIPPEFREHFPSRWNRRFNSRDESEPQTQGSPQPQSPSQQTTATQTEQNPGPSQHDQQPFLPQYGLRNTVDLGQKSPADPSLVDAEERNQRSMSAPPDNRAVNQNIPNKMSDQNHHEQQHPAHPEQQQQASNVRHIPIFVEGRDEPVINRSVDHGEPKQGYAPPPPQPHVDREQYFADEPVSFHAPPNFSRAFGTPFNTFRQGPQPFAQQKVYPQTAFARGASPQRSQSPKPHYPEEHFVKVPVRHEFSKTAPPSQPRQQQWAQQQPQQHPHQQQPQQHPHQQQQPQQQPPQQHPPKQQTPPHQEVPTQQQQSPPQPKPQQPTANDPISQILSIQTDVLNLMTDVENFTGTKKDKKYMYLDEMLTRNLIKLDNIETDGKENIRQARKEAIKCIQKCIAVLEAKAENKGVSTPQPQEVPQSQDVDMKENTNNIQNTNEITENGEVEMKNTKEEISNEPQATQPELQEQVAQGAEVKTEVPKQQEQKTDVNKEGAQPEVADTRPAEAPNQKTETKQDGEEKVTKGAKNVKKRDKSKDKKANVDSNKEQIEGKAVNKVEVMQVDDKGDKADTQTMEVDGAASQ
ncbi:BAG domain-containing protein Samui-like isoform X2 [Achroia grisella]|uniref:BAG domain-containing protein Samui-like isoform X2 n=1 Tax=Achroia grisella TaxID=688607 RepID=UPI0027D276E9|nr:BAG domain-containing protein Samui-like isoform X2 [Achroia grisella]